MKLFRQLIEVLKGIKTKLKRIDKSLVRIADELRDLTHEIKKV